MLKEPNKPSKEPYLLQKEPCVHMLALAKKLGILKRALFTPKKAMFLHILALTKRNFGVEKYFFMTVCVRVCIRVCVCV